MSKVKDFKPARKNANQHTARGLGLIDKSMRTDGYGDPMLAAADGEMISGSARLETVAQVFGTEVEPIIVHSDGTRPVIHVRDDIPNAADKRAVRLALAANRAAELDLSWDVEVLAGLDAADLEGLWTAQELELLTVPGADAWGDSLGALPDGDRAPFQQMTFTLSDEQAEQVKRALTEAQHAGPFVDTGNENSNGNALARICETYLT
jgi:ParB family transcriptional regulator, chromosome partitioning protein